MKIRGNIGGGKEGLGRGKMADKEGGMMGRDDSEWWRHRANISDQHERKRKKHNLMMCKG